MNALKIMYVLMANMPWGKGIKIGSNQLCDFGVFLVDWIPFFNRLYKNMYLETLCRIKGEILNAKY